MPSSNGSEVTVEMEEISPGRAEKILATSLGNPRWDSQEVRDTHVSKIARDMKAGRFYPTSAIVINEDGHLDNGHHRLRAVVESGVTVLMPVVRGSPREAAKTHDTDLMPRSLAQSANAAEWKWLASKDVAKVVRAMIKGMEKGPPYMSRQEEMDFADEHRDAIEFTSSLFPTRKKGLTIAPVQGAVARGYYHVSRTVLERFARCLYTGMPEHSEDASVIRLRDFLLMNAYHGGGGNQAEVYAKSARAIVALRDGQALKALYAVSSDPFPLPGENDDESDTDDE